jgi:hypothetical protein
MVTDAPSHSSAIRWMTNLVVVIRSPSGVGRAKAGSWRQRAPLG